MADSDPGTGPEVQPKDGPLEQRVGAIETEQQRQGGVLEEIKGLLTNGPKAGASSGDASSSSSTGTPPGEPSVAEQVRKGVEEIEARKAKEAADAAAADAEKAWRASVDERLPERKPSEPATGRKAKLQERLFGKPDQR